MKLPTDDELTKWSLKDCQVKIDYVKKYCQNLIELINRDEYNVGYEGFTKERVNIELLIMARDIIDILEGKGVVQ